MRTKALVSALAPMLLLMIAAQQPKNSSAKDEAGSGTVGTISDSKCGLQHTVAPGLGPAGCTRYCVSHGASYILITPENKIYTLKGDQQQLENFAGQSVKVNGAVSGNAIDVRSIDNFDTH